MFVSSSRRQGSTAASRFLSNAGQQQRSLFTPIYVPRLQRLRRGDPLEKQYVQKLFEMKEEQKRGIVWRLASGVVCQREPIILPEKPKWEQEFIDRTFERRRLICLDEEKNLEMMQEWKLGTKKATRKEKKQQKKEQYKEKLAAKAGGEEGEASGAKDEEEEEQSKIKEKGPVEQKRLTFEEMKALIDELSPRVTEADKLDNRKSLERKLSEKLYLIVKKDRAQHAWQFPQGSRDEGETMRKCAERELKEECGKSLKVYFEDNAPAAMLQYVHTDEVKKSTGYHGTKVFFYVASYLDGQVTLNTDELKDYLWVSRDELAEYLDPSLHSVAMKFLPPDFATFQME